MKGQFTILGEKWDNHVMYEGVKKLMRILSDESEQNKLLIKMSVGTSDDSPDDRSLESLVSEVGSKYDIGVASVNAVFPFDLQMNVLIPDTDIVRPTTVKELGVWFGPVGNEVLFARAVKSTGKVLDPGQAVLVDYSFSLV